MTDPNTRLPTERREFWEGKRGQAMFRELVAALDAMPVKEIVFENDEAAWRDESPAKRWERMRAWAVGNLREKPQQKPQTVAVTEPWTIEREDEEAKPVTAPGPRCKVCFGLLDAPDDYDNDEDECSCPDEYGD